MDRSNINKLFQVLSLRNDFTVSVPLSMIICSATGTLNPKSVKLNRYYLIPSMLMNRSS